MQENIVYLYRAGIREERKSEIKCCKEQIKVRWKIVRRKEGIF